MIRFFLRRKSVPEHFRRPYSPVLLVLTLAHPLNISMLFGRLIRQLFFAEHPIGDSQLFQGTALQEISHGRIKTGCLIYGGCYLDQYSLILFIVFDVEIAVLAVVPGVNDDTPYMAGNITSGIYSGLNRILKMYKKYLVKIRSDEE